MTTYLVHQWRIQCSKLGGLQDDKAVSKSEKEVFKLQIWSKYTILEDIIMRGGGSVLEKPENPWIRNCSMTCTFIVYNLLLFCSNRARISFSPNRENCHTRKLPDIQYMFVVWKFRHVGDIWLPEEFVFRPNVFASQCPEICSYKISENKYPRQLLILKYFIV